MSYQTNLVPKDRDGLVACMAVRFADLLTLNRRGIPNNGRERLEIVRAMARVEVVFNCARSAKMTLRDFPEDLVDEFGRAQDLLDQQPKVTVLKAA